MWDFPLSAPLLLQSLEPMVVLPRLSGDFLSLSKPGHRPLVNHKAVAIHGTVNIQ